MKRIFFGWLALALLFAAPVAAQTYPDPESATVNDFAGLLSGEAEAALASELEALRSETGVVMSVVTLSRKETFAPDQSAEEFARGLFDQWQIGDAERKDGVLFLVLHGDREVRIQLGEAYGQDWQLATILVLNRSILPLFKESRFEDGIRAGVSDTIANVVKPYLAGTQAPETEGAGSDSFSVAAPTSDEPGQPAEKGGGASGWWAALIFAPIALLIGWGAMKSKLAKCPQCGNRGLNVTTNRLEEPTATAPGRGERITTCEKCGHRSVASYPIAALGAGDGPGGDSPPDMGGGTSGKGGATGKW